MTVDFDYTIIGGGVIGLACARALAKHGSVLLVEQHAILGSETSSRNSEVIHAGLYYPFGSLKETLCIKGRKQLYDYCEAHDIPHRRIGKLIVSPTPMNPKLAQLEQKALALNIPIVRLNKAEVRAKEPHIQAAEALFSPETGIIDSHTYMVRLSHDAERLGALIMLQTNFKSAYAKDTHWQVTLGTTDGDYRISTKSLINAAGLHSHRVASACGIHKNNLPKLHYCRGHYFSYQSKRPFSHLIYPLPEENLAGLGIHATLDLGGHVKFGPDTEYLPATHTPASPGFYQVPTGLQDKFADAVTSYFPTLEANLLTPDYAGVRPKLNPAGSPSSDFNILYRHASHQPAQLHLLGIESPGLTASLAIADEVVTRVIH